MASPNTLARNAALAHLTLDPVTLTRLEPAARTAPGEYADLLRQSVTIYLRRKAAAHRETNRTRVIPTSGPGRRRAKAHQRAGLCLGAPGGPRCPEAAAYGRFCHQHTPAADDAPAAQH